MIGSKWGNDRLAISKGKYKIVITRTEIKELKQLLKQF